MMELTKATVLGLAILLVCLIYVLGKHIRLQMSCGIVFSDKSRVSDYVCVSMQTSPSLCALCI
jgi:hypothetical protein